MIPTDEELDLWAAELRELGRRNIEPTWDSRFANVVAHRARDLDRFQRLCQSRDGRFWETCLHESGHCVAAYPQGHTLRFVSVIAGAGILGRLRYVRDGARDIESELDVLLAGPMAAHVLAEQPFRLSMEPGGDGSEVKELLWHHQSYLAWIPDFRQHPLYLAALERTRNFVGEARRVIILLAAVLAEYRVIGSAAIDQFFLSEI